MISQIFCGAVSSCGSLLVPSSAACSGFGEFAQRVPLGFRFVSLPERFEHSSYRDNEFSLYLTVSIEFRLHSVL